MGASEREIYIVDPDQDPVFPDWLEPDEQGLVAAGGDLSPRTLIHAYAIGVFPWFTKPFIGWFGFDPAFVLLPDEFHIPSRLAREMRGIEFDVSFDQDFDAVIESCRKAKRPGQGGTWIDKHILEAYKKMHCEGAAHSVEVHIDGKLAGGLYGVALGKAFYGESMFHRHDNAGKIALVKLVERLRSESFEIIDCQMETPTLAMFGARAMPRMEFTSRLKQALSGGLCLGKWD